jgi:hypothetical protein
LAARLTGRVFAAALALAGSTFELPARADLEQDTARLAREWREYGVLHRLKPRLLERGDVRPLLFSPGLIDPTTESCVSVAVLGAPSSNFVLRFLSGGPLSWPQGEWPEASVAGAAQLVRCGARKAMLERLAVEMRSPRAVVEVIAVRAPVPLPSLRRTLAHRDPGPVAQFQSGGQRPASAPIEQRAHAVQERMRRQGAAEQQRKLIQSSDTDGSGEATLRLERGCHRIDVLGMPVAPTAPRGIDIDAELYVPLAQQLLGADHTESADASLSVCVGAPTLANLRFVGSLPGTPVVLLHARSELPAGLPERWGPEPSARIAEALWQSHNRPLPDSPVFESLGVSGVTALPVEVEPGACYLAALAPIRGEPTGVALAVATGQKYGQNQGAPEGGGTALAFCSDGDDTALVEVEARGVGVVWLFAIWQTGRVPLGEVQE